MYRRRINRIVSIVTLLAFLSTNTLYAAPSSRSFFKNKKVDHKKLSDQNEDFIEKKGSVLDIKNGTKSQASRKEARALLSSHLKDLSQIYIPSELGRIIEVYEGAKDKRQGTRPLIVHIQDLHTNPEAELNLAKILEILIKDYNMDLVLSEGADGEVDTSTVSSFPDYTVREKVARLFIDSGELTGEEYLSITKYPDLAIWGIEDRDIYFKNIIEFNKIVKFSPASHIFISQAKKALEQLKPKIYSRELKDLDQKESSYNNQEIEVAQYLNYLADYVEALKINTKDYRNVNLLAESIDQEKTINQQKIMDESQSLLLNLQVSLSNKRIKKEQDELMARAELFRDQKTSPFSFYSYLKDLALRHLKDDLSKYPDLDNYITYLTKVNSLDQVKLFNELKDLAYNIKQNLARTPEQKKFVKTLRNINFLESFFNLKVSNEELDYYLANKDSHKAGFFQDFLKPALKKYRLSSYIDYNTDLIDSKLPLLEDFYKTVKDRDVAMVENSLSEIENRNSKVSALISGGFHTKGITTLLRDKNYSYIVVSPYSSTDIDEENYHFLLSGKRKPLTELLNQLDASEIVNRLSSSLRITIGFDLDMYDGLREKVAPVLAKEWNVPVEEVTPENILGRIVPILALHRRAKDWFNKVSTIVGVEIKQNAEGFIVKISPKGAEARYILATREDGFTLATARDFKTAGETVVAVAPEKNSLTSTKGDSSLTYAGGEQSRNVATYNDISTQGVRDSLATLSRDGAILVLDEGVEWAVSEWNNETKTAMLTGQGDREGDTQYISVLDNGLVVLSATPVIREYTVVAMTSDVSPSVKIATLAQDIFMNLDNRALATAALQYGLTRGYQPLINYISALLGEENIKAHPETEIVILDDVLEGEDILARLLIEKGDIVVYHTGSLSEQDKRIYSSYGVELIEMDLSTVVGINELSRRFENGIIDTGRVKFVQVLSDRIEGTETMSQRAMEELLISAKEFDLLLVEDARYKDPVLSRGQSLKSMDDQGLDSRVVQLRSLSPLFGEGVEIGSSYAVLPAALAVKFEATKASVTLHPNSVAQIFVYKELLRRYGTRETVFRVLTDAEKNPELPFWLSGKLSNYGKEVKLSEIRRILKLMADPDLISLAGGIPAVELFPYEETNELIAEFGEGDWRMALTGSPSQGIERLRSLAAKILSLDAENVLITDGSQEGLDLLGRLVESISTERADRANEVITQKPTYLGFMSAADPYGCEVQPYDLNSLEGLEELRGDLRARIDRNEALPSLMYVMPTFGNPNGDVMTLEERAKLLEIADEFDIAIAEDNPYGALRYEGEAIPTLLELSRESGKATVLYLGTVSKTFTPGMRIGWTVGPVEIIQQLTGYKEETTGGANSLTQVLTANFIETGLIDNHVENVLIAEYSKRRAAMMTALEKYMPEGTTWTQGQGGYFVWVTLPEGVDAEELLVEMTQKGVDGEKVGFVPGWPFLGASNQMRLSFPTNPPEIIDGAVKAVSIAIKDSMGKITLAREAQVPAADLEIPTNFGTAGWRGIDFTDENVRRMAQAIAEVGIEEIGKPVSEIRTAVGYDARPGAREDAIRLTEVLTANGIHVDFIDQVLPTPVMIEVTHGSLPDSERYDFTVHFTASHNPVYQSLEPLLQYKGMKILIEGVPAGDEFTSKISARANDPAKNATYKYISFDQIPDVLIAHDVDLLAKDRARLDKAFDLSAAFREKMASLLTVFPDLRIRISSMNGATVEQIAVFDEIGLPVDFYDTAPLHELVASGGYELQTMDGIMRGPDPTKVYNLNAKMLEEAAGQDIIKFLIDGDGDRLVVEDTNGRPITPNEIGVIIAHYLLQHRGEEGYVVRTLPTTRMLDRLARNFGMPLAQTGVGSKNFGPYTVHGTEQGLVVAIEESGHVFFKLGDEIFVDHAVAEALILLDIMATTGKTLTQYLEEVEQGLGTIYYKRDAVAKELAAPGLKRGLLWLRNNDPELLARAIADELGMDLKGFDPLDKTGVLVTFEDDQWILPRASGTTNTIRIYAETSSQEDLEKWIRGAERVLVRLVNEMMAKGILDKSPDTWSHVMEKGRSLADDIVMWLGWVDAPVRFLKRMAKVNELKLELAREGITNVVVLGTGGSGLGIRTYAEVFEKDNLIVIDLEDPFGIRNAMLWINQKGWDKTVFTVQSKSWGTTETRNAEAVFRQALAERLGAEKVAQHFVAVTDAGKIRGEEINNFRAIFATNYPRDTREGRQIGGRYSSDSFFSLVPAELAGIPHEELLRDARDEYNQFRGELGEYIGVQIGAAFSRFQSLGRNKITFILDKGLEAFGPWVQQLINESVGKNENTAVCVTREEFSADSSVYGNDRVFVNISIGEGPSMEITEQGINLIVRSKNDINRLQYRFKVATTVLANLMGVHPFNQPFVESSKWIMKGLLDPELTPEQLKAELIATASENLKKQGAEVAVYYTGRTEDAIDIDLEAASVDKVLAAFLATIETGDYVYLSPYIYDSPAVQDTFLEIRSLIRNNHPAHPATLFGIGSRSQHSDNQLNNATDQAVIVVLTFDTPESIDMKVPGKNYTLAQENMGHALSTVRALEDKGRRVIRIHLSDEYRQDIAKLTVLFEQAMAKMRAMELARSSKKQQVDSMDQILVVPANQVIANKEGFEKWMSSERQANNVVVIIAYDNDEYNRVKEFNDIAYIRVVGKDISEEYDFKLLQMFALFGKDNLFGGFVLGEPAGLDDFKSVSEQIASGV